MQQTNLKPIYKELERIFGIEITDKVFSHIHSLQRRIEQLTISRDIWKNKYLKLKEKTNKI